MHKKSLTIPQTVMKFEMHGRFDLLLKLRARNLEQMRYILVNSVRKCSRVVELKFMLMLKPPRKNKPYIRLFWRKEKDPSFG